MPGDESNVAEWPDVFRCVIDALRVATRVLARLVRALVRHARPFRDRQWPDGRPLLYARIPHCPACGGAHAGKIAFSAVGRLGPYAVQCPRTRLYFAVHSSWVEAEAAAAARSGAQP